MEMKNINIKAIRIDGGTQSRVSLNESTVSDYADLIKDGVTLPPVVVFHDGSDNWLADGFHRFHAFSKAGKASIPANIISGTCRDAKLYAAGANGTHGLSRTNQDKRRAVEMVLEDADCAENWTDREIAKHCAVSVPFVGAVRRPETAEKQQANRDAHALQAAAKRNQITPKAAGEPQAAPIPEFAPEDEGPSPEEIAASQREAAEELEALRKIAAADDKLAAAIAEAAQLRALNRVLTERNNGLLNEKAELVRRITSLQRKLDKVPA